ncbi:hypothetical protein [Dysosmobacter sp.]|jgi:hypothetical protein|uniref:hypothetical protein n=1 Tax=Dysosmobacter sp. TaxID=2591382 RepID=UPI003D8A3F5E
MNREHAVCAGYTGGVFFAQTSGAAWIFQGPVRQITQKHLSFAEKRIFIKICKKTRECPCTKDNMLAIQKQKRRESFYCSGFFCEGFTLQSRGKARKMLHMQRVAWPPGE